MAGASGCRVAVLPTVEDSPRKAIKVGIKRLVRSKLTIFCHHDYEQCNFYDFYDPTALMEYRKYGFRGDLEPEYFSQSRLWELIGDGSNPEQGFLRLKVDPPIEDYLEYLTLDGTDDDIVGDDDDKLTAMMQQFQAEVQ